MTFDATPSAHSIYSQIPSAYKPRARRVRTARPGANYRSRSTAATLRKQALIRELLVASGEGLTVTDIGRALGISRQLALYHVKKMAATYQLTMVLEPCLVNGGLQFKCWDEQALAHYYAGFLDTNVATPMESYIRELAGTVAA